MGTQTEAARRLYDAFAARDPEAILDSLHRDFVGEVSAGMPLGVGGRHQGPDAMLRDVWAKVFAHYDMQVQAEEFLPSGDEHVTAIGHYRGVERGSGGAVEAAFAHVLIVADDRIVGLRQITDTAQWTP
jgi:ketosteroid isomerase-like protein